MALPALSKTWIKDVNVEERTGGDGKIDRRRILFTIKDKLVNMTVPWTVQGSSDGFTSGFDGPGTDRWATASNVSFGDAGIDGTTGVSWIVLRQSAINAKFEVLLKCGQSSPAGAGNMAVYVSPVAGFGSVNGGTDGGTANASPPTATDQIQILGAGVSGAAWLDGTNVSAPGAEDFILHFWHSNDGECTRIRAYNVGGSPFNCMHVAFEKAKNPIPEWTNPAIFFWNSTSSIESIYSRYRDSNTNVWANSPLGGSMKFYLSSEGVISQANAEYLAIPNDLSGAYEFYPMGLFCLDSPTRGRHGERFDAYWVPLNMVNGMTVPLTPSPTKEFCVFDDMLEPWDGTPPVLI